MLLMLLHDLPSIVTFITLLILLLFFGIITNPIPEGEAFLEALLDNDYGWGPVDPNAVLEDGEPT